MKRKGFTLIELLAVIVVLAIIALIATPIVMNVIKNANIGAAERSADNYVKAVEMLIATENFDGNPINDGEYAIGDEGNLSFGEVEVSGTRPIGGVITIENGQVVKDSSEISYEDYTVIFIDGVATAEESDDDSELARLCTLQNGRAKTVGAEYYCDLGERADYFYVLEVGTNPVVNSTLKRNEIALILNKDCQSYIAWCDPRGDNPYSHECAADGLTERLNDLADYEWTELDREQVSIPSAFQILAADGQDVGASLEPKSYNLSQEWIYYSIPGGDNSYDYWTSTIYDFQVDAFENEDFVWTVSKNGTLGIDLVNQDAVNLRPIIVLSTN